MTLDEPSTINRWFEQAGPINLRRDPERKPDPKPALPFVVWPIVGLLVYAAVFFVTHWRR